MENNEERILIIKITSDPYTCGIGGICKDKVCLKTLCEMGITRQEAIEVMAQAICISNADGCGRRCLQGNCCFYAEREKEAKAALKALLGEEGKNEKNK